MKAFQIKLSELTFLDPACGSGNFLTETYLSLRKLENEVLMLLLGDQIVMGLEEITPIRVSIGQFYGIEINDFAVTVAKTALWIAESQIMKKTEDIVHISLDFLPLKSYANIVESNALQTDWGTVIPKDKLNYIMGNPPFVGQQLRTTSQSEDMAFIFGKGMPETKLDYVLCWYKKSLDFLNTIGNSKVKVAFVSTNSICQGECVPTFWKRMTDEGIDIGFAHRSFKWHNESNENAVVICIVVGFSNGKYLGQKRIIDGTRYLNVEHINAYLQDAPDIWITSRRNIPPEGMPKMIKGSEPTDGHQFFLTTDEKESFEKKYPILKKYIKPFVGGDEFLNNKFNEFTRYCFWFQNGNPGDYATIPEIKERLKIIALKRKGSSADRIRRKAEYPYLFCQIRQPLTDYLLIPRHSSGERRYIPFGFMNKEIIVGDACYIVPSVSPFIFGILISNVHMAWVRLTCGRLGNGYRYSPAIYNSFPWPETNEKQRTQIEQTAQAILNARSLYPDSTLSDLYNEVTMPAELRKAHNKNDKAVMLAYGFRKIGDDGKKHWLSESETVAKLMNLHKKLDN